MTATLTPTLDPEALTTRQAEAMAAFVDLLCQTGSVPTLDLVMGRVDISSKNGLVSHFTRLVRQGWMIPPDRTGEVRRKCWQLSPAALAGLRQVRSEAGQVVCRLLAPEVRLDPDEAEALAGQLLEAAGEARRLSGG